MTTPNTPAGQVDRAEQRACKNTDRELWRETEGDYYSSSIHVTEGGGIGMQVGGYVIVMPVREWHKLARAAEINAPIAQSEQEDGE